MVPERGATWGLLLLTLAPLFSESVASTASGGTCPVSYWRTSLWEVRGGAQPYFLGGRGNQRCDDKGHCDDEPNWKHFCAGDGFGPVCSQQNEMQTVDDLVKLMVNSGQDDLLTSTPCDMWPFLEGRTTWLFGDSQMLDLHKAIVCIMREFVDYQDGPPLPKGLESYGLFQIGRPVSSDDRILRRLRAVPNCVHLLRGARICYIRFDRIEEMEERLGELKELISKEDVTVLNFALHHNADELNRMLPPLLKELKADKRIGSNLYYKDALPQHFPTLYGGIPSGMSPPFKCEKLEGVTLKGDGTLKFNDKAVNVKGETPGEVIAKANMRNANSLRHAALLGIPIIHSYNRTSILHRFHRNNGEGHECSHYCWPVPGLWAHATMRAFRENPPTPLLPRHRYAGR